MITEIKNNYYFATPLWEGVFANINNYSIKEYCYKVKNTYPGVTISNRGGWHSKELIHPIPDELNKLFTQLTIYVNETTFRHLGVPNLILANWWININQKYDYNIAHDHQNSIISGVYYISVPDINMGNLLIHRGDTMEYFLTSRIKNKQTTPITAPHITCTPKESLFYLFPSWVKHSVERNESNQERISIAFNFVQNPDI